MAEDSKPMIPVGQVRRVNVQRCKGCPLVNDSEKVEDAGWCRIGGGFVLYDQPPPPTCPLREAALLVCLVS